MDLPKEDELDVSETEFDEITFKFSTPRADTPIPLCRSSSSDSSSSEQMERRYCTPMGDANHHYLFKTPLNHNIYHKSLNFNSEPVLEKTDADSGDDEFCMLSDSNCISSLDDNVEDYSVTTDKDVAFWEIQNAACDQNTSDVVENLNPSIGRDMSFTHEMKHKETAGEESPESVCCENLAKSPFSKQKTIEDKAEAKRDSVDSMSLCTSNFLNLDLNSNCATALPGSESIEKENIYNLNSDVAKDVNAEKIPKSGLNAALERKVVRFEFVEESSSSELGRLKYEDETNQTYSSDVILINKSKTHDMNRHQGGYQNVTSANDTDVTSSKDTNVASVEEDSEIIAFEAKSYVTEDTVYCMHCKELCIGNVKNNPTKQIESDVTTKNAVKLDASINDLLDLFEIDNNLSKAILAALSRKFMKYGATQSDILQHLRAKSFPGTLSKLKHDIKAFFTAATKVKIVCTANRRYFVDMSHGSDTVLQKSESATANEDAKSTNRKNTSKISKDRNKTNDATKTKARESEKMVKQKITKSLPNEKKINVIDSENAKNEKKLDQTKNGKKTIKVNTLMNAHIARSLRSIDKIGTKASAIVSSPKKRKTIQGTATSNKKRKFKK